MKNLYFLPKTPSISRFSPPWDADGWYYVSENLKENSKIHSNSEEHIKYCPANYRGADFIVTYDSILDGTDDHQECDFYVEANSVVTVAFDKHCADALKAPEWLEKFSVDSVEEILTDKCTYVLYSKGFPAGSHVVIPGFSGKCHHYFVIVKSDEDISTNSLPEIPVSNVTKGEYNCKREYKYYVAEGFNFGVPPEYRAEGETRLVSHYEDDPKYKSVKLTCDATFVRRGLDFSQNIIAKTTIVPIDKNGIYTFGAVKIKKGRAYCGECDICRINYGEDMSIEVKYNLKDWTATATVNNVFQGEPTKVDPCEIISFTCARGEMLINNVYVYDDPEIFVANEDFSEMPEFLLESEATAELAPFPFEKNKSARFTGGAVAYDFPAVSGKMMIEMKVFAESENCCAIFASDTDGNIAAGAALYKNSVFRAERDGWTNVLNPLTPYCYYPAKNFYEIRFFIDTRKQIYDLWVDGARREKGIKFYESVEKVSKLSFILDKKSILYVNSIRIYDDESLARGMLCGKPVDILRYGARGNGEKDDTAAINKAIAAAAYTCRPVYIHDGVYSVGELTLAPDVTIFVDPSAVVLGSQDHKKYPLRVPGQSLCANRQLGRGLIYGEHVRGVTLTGGGMLDGNGLYRFKMNDPAEDKRKQDARPDIVYIAYSSDITIENLNMRRSAFWTVVPLSCRNVKIKNLYLNCMNTPNRDGIDPVDCRNITIHNCNILAGDDGLCFKSSDVGGCGNISVHDMMISSLASAVKFGTDTYYSFENAYFRDCFIKNVNRCGVSLESVDGAIVRNVIFERFDITDASAPAYVVTGARNRLPKGVDKIRVSKMENIVFKSFNFRTPRTHGHPLPIYETMVVGQSSAQCIENIAFEDFSIVAMGGDVMSTHGAPATIDNKYPEYDRHGLSSGYAFTFRYCRNVHLQNIDIVKMITPDGRPIAAFFDCKK